VRAGIAKDAWDNFCATFGKRHVGNILQPCQELLYHVEIDNGSMKEYK
jgi:hypothetical protein